jgi:archaellum component FlaD/FlaE
MSELPWENKKIADIMSSVEEEQSSANASGEKKSSTSPIPDILANAFADIPMEEAKIDVPEVNPVSAENGASQAAFPSFGDLPDLSALGGTQPNVPPAEEKEDSIEVPPFMKSPPNADELGIISSINQSHEPSPATDKPAKKRSPPPLFEPFINSDEPSVSLSPEIDESLPFASDSNQPSQFGAQVEVPPFSTPDSIVSDGVPLESNPFESTPVTAPPADPFVSVGGPVASNPFEPAPVAVPPANPFASVGDPVASNPFESISDAVPPVDPFASAGDPVASNPFEPAPVAVPSADPFSSVGGPIESNPFNPTSGATPSTDPFASADDPVASNPFEPASVAVPPANPFSSAGDSVASNPFEPTSGHFQSQNPFGDQVAADTVLFENGKHAQKVPVKLPIDMGSFKKNLEGISGVTKSFFKNLTKGKSLIERMEDMREDVDVAESKPQLTSNASPFDANPFESSENIVDSSPFSSSLDGNKQVVEEVANGPVNPFMENEGDRTVGAIRQVTPIENPIMEMKEEYLLDNNDFGNDSSIDALSESSELTAEESISSEDVSIHDHDPLVKYTELEVSDGATHEVSDMPEIMSKQEKTSSTSGMELSKKVFTKDIKDLRVTTDKKFENLEDDLGGLKDSLNDMNLQFSSMHSEVEEFSNKISEITEAVASAVSSSENILSQSNSRFDTIDGKVLQVENKISEFDSSIAVLQSDNTSMTTNLSQIEENISELVGSYTALLAQLHESLQENESKFAILAELSSRIDTFGPRVELIEKTQEESKSTSKEFSRSMSSMLDNLGKVSSEFQEFRQESEDKNTAVLEKIDSLTEYMESELKKLGARSYKGFGQNVHLSNIVKNSSNMKLCMEWLEFLMELVGRNNLPDILSYYEELGWVTEKVRMELLHYAEGIDFYMEKPDWKLTPDDHVKSIWFIESLAGMKVDKNRLSVIERDIEKVKKGSEIYGI